MTLAGPRRNSGIQKARDGAGGKTIAALLWIRHHVRHEDVIEFDGIYLVHLEDEPRPGPNGEPQKVQWYLGHSGWPHLGDYPNPPVPRHNHGALYESRLAGRPLLEPFRGMRDYFAAQAPH
jgi:hypothetical protein